MNFKKFMQVMFFLLMIIMANIFMKGHFLFLTNFLLAFTLFTFLYNYMHKFLKTASIYKKVWVGFSYAIVIIAISGCVLNILYASSNNDNPVESSSQVQEEKVETASSRGVVARTGAPKTPIQYRLLSFFGIIVLIGIAALFSIDRRSINWRPVIWGVILQIILGLIVTSPALGNFFFVFVDGAVNKLLSFSTEGAEFVFGILALGPGDPRSISSLTGVPPQYGMFFFFNVLTTIVFFSSLMTILYHIGLMEKIVQVFAVVMQKTMKTSGSETLSAAANIFVGQTEAPLVVKPFVKTMTMSELHAIMTGGFATVAGGVMAAYVMFLGDYIPNIAGHLVTASIMSAPAALAISKVMYPEKEESKTAGAVKMEVEKPDANLVEASARGASEGMTLVLNVAAMLIAFVALVAMVNFALETVSDWASMATGRNPYKLYLSQDLSSVHEKDILQINETGQNYTISKVNAEKNSIIVKERIDRNYEDANYKIIRNSEVIVYGSNLKGKKNLLFVNLSVLLGLLFAPISWVMGVQWSEAFVVGRLLGEKIVLTEFIAYLNLADVLRNGYETGGKIIYLSQRSAIIASYALCGFANFASIGIQIGGIGGIAPNRRADLARIGFRSMFAGAIAACMTGTIAGILM